MKMGQFNSKKLNAITFTMLFVTQMSLFVCCSMNKQEAAKTETHSFYVGTYTKKESRGIYKYLLKSDGTIEKVGLAAVSWNPSFFE